MSNDIKTKWNARHAAASGGDEPVAVLKDYAYLLPATGRALDLACGRGRNALFLAQQGLQVDAWDIAEVAIEQLAAIAQEQQLPITAEVRDVVEQPLPGETYDVVLVSYFLERELARPLIQALKPNGLLFYQTFSRARVDDTGPGNPAFRLAPNELLQLFAPLQVLVYHDEDVVGDTRRGVRNVAQLVARKPA